MKDAPKKLKEEVRSKGIGRRKENGTERGEEETELHAHRNEQSHMDWTTYACGVTIRRIAFPLHLHLRTSACPKVCTDPLRATDIVAINTKGSIHRSAEVLTSSREGNFSHPDHWCCAAEARQDDERSSASPFRTEGK